MKGFKSILAAVAVASAGAAFAADEPPPEGKAAQAKQETAAAQAPLSERRVVRDGVVIDFEALPAEGGQLTEGDMAEVRFRITDERTGKPVQGARPGAWMDVGASMQGRAGAQAKECKEKIGLYLKGAVGIRPLVDLNGYYLLVMNKDASITVIDPMVSMAGRTSTLAAVTLSKPPMDWANHAQTKRLFVTMPSGNAVSVVDTESFKVVADIDAGAEPVRIVAQPDGKYLWVGNNSRDVRASGVTVIDARDMKVVMQTPTGRGHHEIAISPDSRYAFVTNRDDGTVTVFDVAGLKKVKEVKTGSMPISVAYSALSRAAYVADGKEGTITVIDGSSHEIVKRIEAKPGLGPMRFTGDGRYGMVVNTSESVVYIIDPGTNEILATPKVQDQPFQVMFSRDFAYVRSLGSERVSMINLSSIGKGKDPFVQSFLAGAHAPKMGGDIPIADALVPALGEAAVFVVSPADNATYFYMEGMNAPMSSYQSRGKLGRAVAVVDRSLKEVEPGVFSGRFRMPAAGRFDVAFALDQPQLLHCFATEAKPSPELEKLRQTTAVEFLPQERVFKVGDRVNMRLRVFTGDGSPKTGLKDVLVRYFLVPAAAPRDTVAREVGEGIYEATLDLAEAGAYYVYVSVPSLKASYSDLSFFSVMARPNPSASPAPVSTPPAAPAPAKAKKAEKKG